MKKEFQSDKGTYKVTFSLPKEAVSGANGVVVLGDFNNWNREGIRLASKNGSYQACLELNAGRYEFRYLIDNAKWENDWAADAYVASPFDGIENSVVSLEAIAPPKAKAPKKKTAKKATPKKATTKKAAPKAAKKDDLTKVEGIGPKLASVLAEAGIATFKKLAVAKAEKVSEILVAYNKRYKMYDTTTWPKQAKLAADGKWAELQKWQDELNGGKAKK